MLDQEIRIEVPLSDVLDWIERNNGNIVSFAEAIRETAEYLEYRAHVYSQ